MRIKKISSCRNCLHAFTVRWYQSSVSFINISNHLRDGNINKAEVLWNKLKDETRDINKWNKMLTEYVQIKQYNKALLIFEEMQRVGMRQNYYSYSNALHACIHLKLLSKAMDIHQQIAESSFIHNHSLQQQLLRMYNKLWSPLSNSPPNLTASHYKLMMSLILKIRRHSDSNTSTKRTDFSIIQLYKHAQTNNIEMDEQMHLFALKDCAHFKLLDEAKNIHKNFMIFDVFMGNKVKNLLIATYSQCNDYSNAWNVYQSIQHRDIYSYLNALILCGHWNALKQAKRVHTDIIHSENGEQILQNVKIQSALINMYGKCGDIESAKAVWNEIDNSNKNMFMFGSMMAALIKMSDNRLNNAFALRLFEQMTESKQLKPDVLTLTLALRACGNLREFDMGKKIFSQLSELTDCNDSKVEAAMIIFCVKCDRYLDDEKHCRFTVDSFREAILSVNKNQNTDCKDFVIYALIKEFKQRHIAQFGENEWLAVIDGYGLIADTDSMMNEYENMSTAGEMIPSCHILVTLLQHLLKHGEPQRVETVWNHIIDKQMDIAFNSMALQSFVLCIDRSRHYHKKDFLKKLWNLVVFDHSVEPNLHCFCLAILAFSKYDDLDNQTMAKQLLLQLESDESLLSMMATNPLSFMQILTAYGNIGHLDKMWTFYLEHIDSLKNNKRCQMIVALMLLSSKQTDSDRLNQILNVLDEQFDFNKHFSADQLISFHRVAIKCKNERMQQNIWNVLQGKEFKIKTNVLSTFVLNGREHSISTGYDVGGCPFDSHQKVDAMMKPMTKYKIDTSICPELKLEIAKQRHLKSHSEKKALAVLLSHKLKYNEPDKNIKIKVSMRMCSDCHSFFEHASREYPQFEILCVDPKGIHRFKEGVCWLCTTKTRKKQSVVVQ